MKRSILLEVLTREFKNTNVLHPMYSPEKQAVIILDLLEKFGMLPPSYLKPTNNLLIPGDLKRPDGRWGTPTNEWEPENE